MSSVVNLAIMRLEEQQSAVKPRSAQWMVAEQLMDICRREPASAELIYQDLANDAMSITAAEKQIKTFADKHRTGSFACVSPSEAEDILRKFYGLPSSTVEAETIPAGGLQPINLADFFGG